MTTPRERARLWLYDSRDAVLKTLRTVSFLAALLSLAVLAWFNGFPQTEESAGLLLLAIKLILSFFVAAFVLRVFYSLESRRFLRDNWPEGLLMLMLVVDGISLYILNFPLLEHILLQFGIENFTGVYILFIQFYILIIAGLEMMKGNTWLGRIRIKPSVSLALSLLILSIAGTFLLMLPEMRTGSGPMPFIDALFTSVSAVSHTGLIVVDTATYFTMKGQFIVLLLIQIGALGIVFFGTFFGTYLARGLALKQQHSVYEFFAQDGKFRTEELIRQIIYYTFFIDVLGAVILFFLWDPSVPFGSLGEKIFHSLFHSVSAFCNAGFSTFTNGTYNEALQHSHLVHLTVCVLIILGSIGFPVLHDVFGIESIRDRLRQPWKRLNLNSRISLYSAGILTLSGAILFFLLEQQSTLKSMDPASSVIASLFQSVTARSAGFNTVDIGLLTPAVLIMLCFLMFVGGGSGSLAGGIRTSTFAVMCISAYNAVRGKDAANIGRHRITPDIYGKVISIFLFATCFVFLATLLLTVTEPDKDFIQLAFEAVSAFGTVGLSTGITSGLSEAGKWIITICMFVGRVGTLTLVVALSSQVFSTPYSYPRARIMLG